MKPDAVQLLNVSALQLFSQIAPLLPQGYPQGTASLVAILLMIAARECERGAEIRATENAEMRALLAGLARFAPDSDLKAHLLFAAGESEPALTISALDAANHELRRLLIRLQSAVEDLPGADAREAERRIWKVLRASADRRLIPAPI